MARGADRDRAKRRQAARLDLLKRRIGVASLVGFAGLFGLAAQHAVKGSAGRAVELRQPAAAGRTAGAAPTTFFDQTDSGFSFGAEDATPSSGDSEGAAAPSQPPPVAQSSVS